MRRFSRAFEFVVTVAQVAQKHHVTYPAAALAYYAFVSQVPLLVLLLAFLGESLASQTRAILPTYLTPDAQQLVSEALTSASGSTLAMVLGVGVFAWSGTNIVLGFQTVIERVGQSTKKPLLTQLRDAGSILGSFTLVIVSVVLTNLVFALLPLGRVLSYSEPFVQFGILTIAFVPLYYAPSQAVSSLKEALPGALTAAAGWTGLLTGIQMYATNAAQFALFGVLSGIIIILTSLYLGSVILMLGVVVNTVAADTDTSASSLQA